MCLQCFKNEDLEIYRPHIKNSIGCFTKKMNMLLIL